MSENYSIHLKHKGMKARVSLNAALNSQFPPLETESICPLRLQQRFGEARIIIGPEKFQILGIKWFMQR